MIVLLLKLVLFVWVMAMLARGGLALLVSIDSSFRRWNAGRPARQAARAQREFEKVKGILSTKVGVVTFH